MSIVLPILLTFFQEGKDIAPAVVKKIDVATDVTIIRKPLLNAPPMPPENPAINRQYIALLDRHYVAAMAVRSGNLTTLKSFAGVADPVEKVREGLVVRVDKANPNVFIVSFACTDAKEGQIVLTSLIEAVRECLAPKGLTLWCLSAPSERLLPPRRP